MWFVGWAADDSTATDLAYSDTECRKRISGRLDPCPMWRSDSANCKQ